MKRRTADEWHSLFAEHKQSGLSAASFCRERGLCPKYFSLRQRQLDAHSPPAPAPAFIPVSMPPSHPATAIEIQLGGGVHLRVPTAVSPRWLGELLHQLRA